MEVVVFVLKYCCSIDGLNGVQCVDVFMQVNMYFVMVKQYVMFIVGCFFDVVVDCDVLEQIVGVELLVCDWLFVVCKGIDEMQYMFIGVCQWIIGVIVQM